MEEVIAIIIFIGSIVGMGIIIFRKIPTLATLPNISPLRERWILRLGNKLKEIPLFKNFTYELFLQKILTKMKILLLKIENSISQHLQKLREKYQKKRNLENDNYWEKIKKLTKKE